MKKIIVSVTNDLNTDQRVHKVCLSLVNNGFEVLLIGRKLSTSLPLNRRYATHRMSLLFKSSVLFYLEYNFRLFFYLLFHKKDILLANDLDTLLANFLVSRIQNKKLVYDSHELFTEVPELIHRPSKQKIWLQLERYILPKLKNTYTVCQSIADYYNQKYATNFKVIRNIPIKKSRLKIQKNTKQKTIIYQGAINIGRGLELMIEVMKYLENIKFIIVGTGDIYTQLQKKVVTENVTDKITFLGKITPIELQKITPKANLGISLEEDLGLNYRYALPNKLFDYVHANIPVLVSDLPEMKQLVLAYKIGEIAISREPKKLAKQIKKILHSEKEKYQKSLEKAQEKLHWQHEEKILLSVFNNLK